MIPQQVERRARWVLDSIGARDLELGDAGVPYRPDAWGAIERGERPEDDALAEAFYDLARIEELGAPLDEHGRFGALWSSLDPLDPPLERLRHDLGVTPNWDGATFVVALTHDVDSVRRWTRIGLRGAAARLKADVAARRAHAAAKEAKGLALAPLHKLRGTDPNWRFEQIVADTRSHGATGCTFYVLGGHADPHDGAAPEVYEQLRPRLVDVLRGLDVEIGLHGSYRTAHDGLRLAHEKHRLGELGARVVGHRYHYLRVDPHHNLEAVANLRLRYDSTLGFADSLGFRAGIARPFHPWDLEIDEPLDIVELPLAVMDVTLAEPRYLGAAPRSAWPLLERLLDWAAANQAGFAVLWHPDRFDPATAGGWDRLYFRFVDGIHERGGRCMSAADLVELWLSES